MTRKFTIFLQSFAVCLLVLASISASVAGNPSFRAHPASGFSYTVDTCALVCPGNLSFTLNPGECDVVVIFDVATTGDCFSAVPVQTSGLPSGAHYPVGVTHNCFVVDLDPVGSPDGDLTCCFDVTVLAYPNPISSIVCNDLVFVALDGNCQHCINASEVLEGGPYGCYDNYIVELDKTPPYGNGPWVQGCVTSADINKTYQVRITDPQTGNKCWGNVKAEDKQTPTLSCSSVQLPCNFPNLAPEHIETSTSTLKFAVDSLPVSIDTGAYFTFNIPVNMDAIVNDVDCRVKITNALAWNAQIEVISPAGTSAVIWDGLGGCGLTDSIFARFDDEGLESNLCNDIGADLNLDIMSVMGYDSLSVFDGENALGNWQIKISNPDAQGFGQVIMVEIAELFINQTGQFSAGFPNGLSSNCVQAMGGNQYMVPAGCGTPTLDNCSNVTLSYEDNVVVDDCNSSTGGHIDRVWTAKDASGNISTCSQRIDQLRSGLADVVLPPDYDNIDYPSFSCNGGEYPSPTWIANQGLQSEPLTNGFPLSCNLAASYTDLRIDVCDGTYKIRRDWTIINWCTGDAVEHSQIIKVVDNQGPAFACPQGLTVTTNAFDCCANVDLPDVVITDACSRIHNLGGQITLFDAAGQQTGIEPLTGSLTSFSGNDLSNPDTMGAFGSTVCLPPGSHVVEYIAEDDCGNTTTCSFSLTIHDYTSPIAVCDESTVVAIGQDDAADCFGPSGPNNTPPALDDCHFGGVVWVKAITFDDGSYDACDSVKFTIRRLAPYSDCVLGLNSVNGHTSCSDFFPDFPSEFERAISEADSIKFYSCEVGTIQNVLLRTYQIDHNGNFAIGPDGFPIFNECTVKVEVEDKVKPTCTPPPNVSVTCEQFDPSLQSYGVPTLLDNCCLDGTHSDFGQCGLSYSVSYLNFDTICTKGTIVRKFNAYDCSGNSSLCTQQIVVNYNQDYYVRFPDDVIVTTCDGTGYFGEPTFFGQDCELLATSYEDQIFTVVPDACFKIERRWTIINWCTFNPNIPAVVIPNPQPNAVINNPANLPGPIVSACGTPVPWASTIVKINPTDATPTDYCTFWDANANRYEYLQIIKVIDTAPPVISDCPANPLIIQDASQNDPELWHNVFDPNLPSQDLPEGIANLTIHTSDNCSGANLADIRYLLFLDLDNNGTLESVLQSNNLPGADTVLYDNINAPGYLGGTPVTFDGQSVPNNQKWHFTLERTVSASEATASVRWNTAASPDTYVVPQLPQGTHKIKWFVTDMCGNESVCEYGFTIKQDQSSGTGSPDSDGFALLQNEPNPFQSNTRIGFLLPEAAEATLSVYDTEGRLVFSQNGNYNQGYNSVKLEGAWLHGPAVMYYKLESGTHVAWKKMVLIR